MMIMTSAEIVLIEQSVVLLKQNILLIVLAYVHVVVFRRAPYGLHLVVPSRCVWFRA